MSFPGYLIQEEIKDLVQAAIEGNLLQINREIRMQRIDRALVLTFTKASSELDQFMIDLGRLNDIPQRDVKDDFPLQIFLANAAYQLRLRSLAQAEVFERYEQVVILRISASRSPRYEEPRIAEVVSSRQVSTPHPSDLPIYNGTQKDADDREQTAAIRQCLRGAAAHLGPIQLPLSLASLEFELRPWTRGPAVRAQKEALYGGMARLRLGPLGFAALDLIFERSLTDKIHSQITALSQDFSSHTVVARPGQGKSILLAQVLLRLLASPGHWTFWSFEAHEAFKCEESVQCIEKYFQLIRQAACVPKRLIFIFDDLDRRSDDDYNAILAFHSYCEQYSKSRRAGISFLLSSADRDYSITDDILELLLDTADEKRLYEALLVNDPQLAGKAYDTLDELLRAHPITHAWKSDVQSATDYIVEHSKPLRDFTPEWFSDLTNEPPLAQRALPTIAVSTLLDLELPDHIAHEMCEFDQAVQDRKGLISYSRRIGYEKKGTASYSKTWPGYVLRSPYYAGSLLRRLEKLEKLDGCLAARDLDGTGGAPHRGLEAFVKEAIVQMVSCSLNRAERDPSLWEVTDAEFLRVLFHRLAKRKVNRLAGFSDGTQIAADLFARYGDRILKVLRSFKSAATYANWAGTFSYILVPRMARHFGGDAKTTEQMVYELCSYGLKESTTIDDPQVFVTLLLAIRAVCYPYSGDQRIVDLAEAADRILDLDMVLDSARAIANPDAERRSNQVLLSYTKFLQIIPKRSAYERCRKVSNVYDRAEQTFSLSNLRFDALNFLERAQAIWVRNGDSAALKKRCLLLREARVAASQRSQLRHRAEVERAIANFEIEYRQAIDDLK